jgi:hypothetical protein
MAGVLLLDLRSCGALLIGVPTRGVEGQPIG